MSRSEGGGWQDRVEVARGDITRETVDAIVNAANESLLGGGGVDGAIHRAAGPELLAECRTLGRCPTGEARITRGYRLPARHVVHTVGPVWHGGRAGEAALLESCYHRVFDLLERHALTSVAFPAISCGVYGYPLDQATRIAVAAIAARLQANPQVRRVRIVCFSDDVYAAYIQAIAEWRGNA